MKDHRELQEQLNRIDRKGYKAYQDIKGQYSFDAYVLSIDHVQSDPFAPPSKVRVILEQSKAGFPAHLFDQPYKRTAVVDFLTRLFWRNIQRYYRQAAYGTGKSGLLTIDHCGQEILDRTSVVIDEKKVEARFEIGLPAMGRTILSREAASIFFEVLPVIVKQSLIYGNLDKATLNRQVELAVDQAYLREEIKKRNLVAFVANGSILPRESGISDKPLMKGAVPFQSPPSLEVEITLPNRGRLCGMGIPEGVTLIVGGGYHGKSTLLNALELGVYNHIEGDGREFVCTRENGVKIRAEDGRRIENVNISSFINHLPNGQDTQRFSSENASGSTSQAANIMEALETGTELLLIDEDTSATNFMIRDGRMQLLVDQDKEPITPFIDKVRSLYRDHGVSTIVVVGGSGDYFRVADTVIMMDEYRALDVTEKAHRIAREAGDTRIDQSDKDFGHITPRVVLSSSFPEGRKGIRIKAQGLHTVLYNKSAIDLSALEQLVDTSQTNCISVMLQYLMENLVDDRTPMMEIVDKMYKLIEEKGLDALSRFQGHPGNLALPRKQELAAALNRFRYLRCRQ